MAAACVSGQGSWLLLAFIRRAGHFPRVGCLCMPADKTGLVGRAVCRWWACGESGRGFYSVRHDCLPYGLKKFVRSGRTPLLAFACLKDYSFTLMVYYLT